VGGGVAGLVAAWRLAAAGCRVTLAEKEDRLGGLAASFTPAAGVRLERYYHFICKPDREYLSLLDELGLGHRLRWVTTAMGFFHAGRLRPLGEPFSLLAHPDLGLADKLRFAVGSARAKAGREDSWKSIENTPAVDWLSSVFGKRVHDLLYRPLLEKKFRRHAGRISAAWMWSRLNRLGRSRTLLQRERLGYVEGGSQVLIDALAARLRVLGVEVRLGAGVERLAFSAGRVEAALVGGDKVPVDCMLSTVPIPRLLPLLQGLSGAYFDRLRALDSLHVRTAVMRLRQPLTRFFWTNINDARIDLPGLIEYTNLNPMRELGGDAIVYLPQYLGEDHLLWHEPDDRLVELYTSCLGLINPEFSPGWIEGAWVFRTAHAQPICEVGFSSQIPSICTPVPNLFLTDSCQLHPHDRTISKSVALGDSAARHILAGRPF